MRTSRTMTITLELLIMKINNNNKKNNNNRNEPCPCWKKVKPWQEKKKLNSSAGHHDQNHITPWQQS